MNCTCLLICSMYILFGPVSMGLIYNTHPLFFACFALGLTPMMASSYFEVKIAEVIFLGNYSHFTFSVISSLILQPQ